MDKLHSRSFGNKYLALLLTLVILFSFFCGYSQYNPTTGTVSNKPYSPAQAVPTDSRSMFFDNINFIWRPYQSVSEVKSYLNLSKSRTGNFIIVVDSGGALQSNGTYIGGVNTFWMFKDSTADANLVKLNLFGTGGVVTFNGRSGVVAPQTGDYTFAQIGSPPTTIAGYGITDAVSLTGVQTLTNKTISGINNTFSNIPNSALSNNSIGLTIGTSGSDINVGVTPAALGTSLAFNIPTAGTGTRGALSAANWNYFNSKVDSVHFSNDSLYDFTGGVGTFRGFITGTGGIASLNGLTASSQTFLTGTSGADFNIVSSVASHTFNFPNASSVNRGLLTPGDWATFNSKQPQLNGTGLVRMSGTTVSYDNSVYLTNITGLVTAGSGIGIGGSGTVGSPYVISFTGSSSAPPNIGSGYRIYSPQVPGLKTLFGINGILVDSTTNSNALTFQVDSGAYATRTRVQKGIDSLGVVKQAALSGTGYLKFAGTTPSYLTPTQVTADLNLFTNTLQGLVPASGGGTTNFLRADGTWAAPAGGGGGTVTSVAATVPSSLLTVSGSPITTSGTLAFGLANFSAHTYLGNNTGSSTTPIQVTNTQLTADLNIFSSSLQGLVPASGGGTLNFLRADGTWTTPGGGGTVTSVAATVPSALLTISGSPITGAGTLAIGLANGAANTAFGNFTGSSGPGAYGKVPLAAFATGTANSLDGKDGSGNPSPITAGANISISGSVISATALPATIFNVKSAPFNAFGDGTPWSDGSMTSGSATLTSGQATFTAGDVGKYVNIKGVGASSHPITTTIIAFIDAHHVTLNTSASTTASNCYFVYGHDDTQAIQAAIDSAYTHGGGQVAFPNGYYLIAGSLVHSDNNTLDPNSQLFMPSQIFPENGGPAPITVTLQGESRPTADYGALSNDSSQKFNKGVIIRSILMTNQGTGALLGTAGSSGAFGSFSNLTSVVSNLTLITPDDTTAGAFRNGIDFGQAAWMEINNCVVTTDVPLIQSHRPIYHTFGMKTTNISGGTTVYLSGINFVAGYESGYVISEHLVADNLQAAGCLFGIQAVPGNHVMHIFTAKIQWCASSLYKSTAAGVAQVQIEQLDMEGLINGNWFDYVNSISDSSNLMTGYVWYLFGASSLGTPTNYVMYGGKSYSFQSKQIKDAVLFKDHTINGSVRNIDSVNTILSIANINNSLGTAALSAIQVSNGSVTGNVGITGQNFTTSGQFVGNGLMYISAPTNKGLLLTTGGTTTSIAFSGDNGTTQLANLNESGNIASFNMQMPVAGASIFQAYNLKNDAANVVNIGQSSSTYTTNPFFGQSGFFVYNGGAGGISFTSDNASGTIRFGRASLTESARFASSGNFLEGTTTDNAAFIQMGANTTTKASLFFNGASSDVTSPTNGMMWYNSTAHTLNFRDNGTTTNLLAGGGGLTTVAFSNTANANGGSISGVTLTLTAADGTHPGGIQSSGSQTLAPVLTMPAPLFTSLTSGTSTDSILVENPATGQVRRIAQLIDTTNVANGLTATVNTPTNTTITLGGTLNQNTTIDLSGTGWQLSINHGAGTNGLVINPAYVQIIGAAAVGGWGTSTATGNVTITTSNHYSGNFLDNPPSSQTSFTFTLPPSPVDGEIVNLFFGGTIANGSTVTTSFSITVPGGSGMVIFGATPSATVVSGDSFSWKYYAAGNAWYRQP